MSRGTRFTGRGWRGVVAVVAVAGLLWVALAAWAFSSPVGASPDDDFHIANIYCAAGLAECVEEGERVKPCFAAQPYVAGECQRDGLGTIPRSEGMILNYYPPLYNSLMSNLVGETIADSVRNVRLANVSVAVAMIVGSIVLSRRSLRVAVATGWVVFAVPLTVFMASSISPNAWSILGLGAMWGPALSYLTENTRRKTSIARVSFVIVGAAMALGSRSETPMYVGILSAALLVAALPWPLSRLDEESEAHRKLMLPLGLAVAAMITLILFGSRKIMHSIAGDYEHIFSVGEAFGQVLVSPLAGLGTPGLPANMLGWSDTIMPPFVSYMGDSALVIASVVGLSLMYTRKMAILATFGIFSLLLMLYFWSIAWHTTRYPPRYFLPLFIVTVGLFMLPRLDRPKRIPGIRVLPILAGLVAVGNSLALMTNTGRYTVGISDVVKASPQLIQEGGTPWWWWNFFGLTPYGQWILGTVAFTAAGVLGALLVTHYAKALPTQPVEPTNLRGAEEWWREAAAIRPAAGTREEVLVTTSGAMAVPSNGGYATGHAHNAVSPGPATSQAPGAPAHAVYRAAPSQPPHSAI